MSAQMLKGGFLAVMEARSAQGLRDEVVRFAQRLGFTTVNAMVVIDHAGAESEFHAVDNTPAGYAEAYADPELARIDPVMQHCKHAAVPIVWNQDTYVSRGRGALWEHQARFGYRTGIALALHLPQGRHFFLGVDRDQPLSRNRNTLTQTVAELQLFAVHAQEAAFRLLGPGGPNTPNTPSAPAAPGDPPPCPSPLTPRERAALCWTMEGKTAWEVGKILNISERTAVAHLQNATHKLACSNKHQAVLKALRLGLLA